MKRLLFVLLVLAQFYSFADYAPSAGNAYTEPVRSEKIGFFRKGEGCVAGFKRIGYRVTMNTCIQAANNVGIDILLYFPETGGETTMTIDVKEGQSFSVLTEKGRTSYHLHKKRP